MPLRDRAVLVITHDTATARAADRIVVLAHGRVAEEPLAAPRGGGAAHAIGG
jgi:ABC-type multidrug transport system fused ATPase/permease subunit